MASQPADRAGARTVDLQAHGASPLGQRYIHRLDVATGDLQRLAATPAARSRCSGLVGRYRGREMVAVYVADRRVYLQHGTRRYDLTDGRTTIVCRAQGALVSRYAIVRDGLEVAHIRVRLPLLTLLSYGDDLDCEQDDLLFYLSQSPGFVSWALETWRDSG
jgi:hypothetical protein